VSEPAAPVPAPIASPAPTPEAVTDQGTARTVGRGFLFILAAKLYFLLTGFAVQFSLPRLFLATAQKLLAAGEVVGLSAARVAEGMYGDYGVATRTVSWINNTVVQGTIQAVSKYVAEDDRRAEAVRATGLRLQAVVGAVLAATYFLGSGLLATLLSDPRLAKYFRITAVIILAYSLYAVFIGYLNGRKRFRAQATFDVSFSTIKTFSMLSLAFLGYGVAEVLGAFAGAAIAICLAAFLVVGVRVPAGSPPFRWRQLVRGMALVIVYFILFNGLLTADVLVLKGLAGRFVGEAGARAAELSSALVGIYNGVLNVALLPYQAVLAVAFVVFPLISKSTFDQDRAATQRYIEGTLRYALLFVGGVAVLLLAAPEKLLALINPSFAVGAPALRIYLVGEVFFALFAIANTIIIASGRMGAAAVLAAGTLLTDVLANLLVVPHFLRLQGDALDPGALQAAAGATAPVFALGFVAASWYLWRRFGARPRLGLFGKVLALIGVLSLASAQLSTPSLPVALLLIAGSGAAYLAGLLLLRELGAADLARLRLVLGRRG